ncbi:MAG TPA: hypothetical protein VER03_24030 [Bryobacteraceae bacterium]|nr:hypothetical protein [Bryobacteraceae bacterium]
MSNTPPGSYRITADRTGFVRTDHGATNPTRPGPPLTLAPGQALKQVTIRMQTHAVVAGRVLDEDGEPLANIHLQASSYS